MILGVLGHQLRSGLRVLSPIGVLAGDGDCVGAAHALNGAEAVVDRVSPQIHPTEQLIDCRGGSAFVIDRLLLPARDNNTGVRNEHVQKRVGGWRYTVHT